MRRQVALLALLFATSAGCAGAKAASHVLGVSTKGLAILSGNELSPPYVIEVGYRIEARDTIYEQIYFNKIPLWAERGKLNARTARELTREELLVAAARESTTLASVRAMPRDQAMAVVARAYSRDTDLVDSARVLSAHLIRVYWKSGGTWDLTYSDHPTTPLAERSKVIALYAGTYLAHLRQDSAVLLGAGELVVPLAQRAELMKELEDIRSGGSGAGLIIRDPQMQALIREPKPISPEAAPGR